MKNIFLKALEMGWEVQKKKGLVQIDRQQLRDAAMSMLKGLGNTQITEEDINEVIDKVWGKEDKQ